MNLQVLISNYQSTPVSRGALTFRVDGFGLQVGDDSAFRQRNAGSSKTSSELQGSSSMFFFWFADWDQGLGFRV